MKLSRFLIPVALLIAVTSTAFVAQNPDPAGFLDVRGSTVAGIGINVARTGAAVDRQGYAGAMVLVAQGHVTNGAGAIVYWVLQDSSLTPAQVWTARDSILADTVDNKGFKLSYTGAQRFVRTIQRATSASSDTTISGGLVILTGKRVRP
jgi:hypothetical protein